MVSLLGLLGLAVGAVNVKVIVKVNVTRSQATEWNCQIGKVGSVPSAVEIDSTRLKLQPNSLGSERLPPPQKPIPPFPHTTCSSRKFIVSSSAR